MARTRRQRWSRRPRFVLAVLVLLSVSLITLDVRGGGKGAIDHAKTWASDIFDPVRAGVDEATRPVAGFFAGAFEARSIQADNSSLRSQLGSIQEQLEQEADLKRRITALQNLYDLQFANGIPEVVADVVDLGTSDFSETIDIDKGTSSGIDDGMPVVSGDGLIGFILQANDDSSTVQLLTDPSSSVGVKYGAAGADAVVGGQGSGRPLSVDYVQPGSPVKKGEQLLTSGLANGAFPEGIPVATVSSFSNATGTVQQNVTATPVANMADPEYVAVLQWEPQP
jgi:rod shape-determining protein MreC